MNSPMRPVRKAAAVIAIAILSTIPASRAWGHCDTLDGPLVPEAQRALESGNITPVLKWVRTADEAEIQSAFEKTLAVRNEGPAVREMADRAFLETLVRIHRQGEGAAYTGLKPVGSMEPVFAEADEALATGEVDRLADEMAKAVREAIQKRFADAQEHRRHADESVMAGREYVDAYVTYVHFVEGLHDFVVSTGSTHEGTPPAGHSH